MTIYLNTLDKATARRIEYYVRDNFTPDMSENLSGGSWSEFKHGNIVISYGSLREGVEVRIGNQELFADSKGSKLYKLLEEANNYHVELWRKEQRDKANKIMDKVIKERHV